MKNVLVIGAGNAGLCAAIAVHEAGGRATVLEWANEDDYCSDSFFSGGLFRVAYDSLASLEKIVDEINLEGAEGVDAHERYDESDFLADWGRVTGYRCDAELAELVVAKSFDTLSWMAGFGVPFRSPIVVDTHGQARHSRPGWHGGFVEASGAGVGLTEALFAAARKADVDIRFGCEIRGLEPTGDGWTVTGRHPDGSRVEYTGDAVIIASGGFQADLEWRTRVLGPGWDLAKVRGSKYNTGLLTRAALDLGATPYGNWSGCHAVAWSSGSGDAGRADANHVFERESYPFGITLNCAGERFVDEATDFGAYTYARYGRAILAQENQIAWQIFDQKSVDLFTTEYHYKNPEAARVQADTLESLFARLAEHGLDAERALQSVEEYNAAVDQTIEFNPYVKDGRGTRGLPIDKSNWSQTITDGPFLAFEVTCGITFTFGGLRIDPSTQVLRANGQPMPGLYACGEAVGGLYYYNYASGTGLTAGSVFGRIAGSLAAGMAQEDLP